MIKTCFILLLIFHIISCKSAKQTQVSDSKDTVITNEEIIAIIQILSSDYYEGREFGTDVFFDIFQLSDNYPLYKTLKVPAHTFCTFDFSNYEHYHRVSDEIQNLDIENTGIIVRNIAKGVTGLVNSAEKVIRLTNN